MVLCRRFGVLLPEEGDMEPGQTGRMMSATWVLLLAHFTAAEAEAEDSEVICLGSHSALLPVVDCEWGTATSPRREGNHWLKARKEIIFCSASLSRIAWTPRLLLWHRKLETHTVVSPFPSSQPRCESAACGFGPPLAASQLHRCGFIVCPGPGLALSLREAEMTRQSLSS